MKAKKRTAKNKFLGTFFGCRKTTNRTPWCYGICTPNKGKGECGRVAPHALTSRIQTSIRQYKRKNSC